MLILSRHEILLLPHAGFSHTNRKHTVSYTDTHSVHTHILTFNFNNYLSIYLFLAENIRNALIYQWFELFYLLIQYFAMHFKRNWTTEKDEMNLMLIYDGNSMLKIIRDIWLGSMWLDLPWPWIHGKRQNKPGFLVIPVIIAAEKYVSYYFSCALASGKQPTPQPLLDQFKKKKSSQKKSRTHRNAMFREHHKDNKVTL